MLVTNTYLFTHGLNDYGYLVIMAAVACIFVPVTGFEANNNVIIIKKYYLFALLYKTTCFNKTEKFQLQPFEIELTDAGDELAEGGFLSLFLLSMPYKATVNKITITQQSANVTECNASVTLSSTEYKLLQHFLDSQQPNKNREFDAPGFPY